MERPIETRIISRANVEIKIKPQWYHPLLEWRRGPTSSRLELSALRSLSYDYYLRFLPFFRGQAEGSISTGVEIEFTKRMRQKLGVAMLFEHKIRLNENYFAHDPSLLPYTLFHELTHVWLYDCHLDPGHTRRFYQKMREFESSGLPVDEAVHIHGRMAAESQHVYQCPNCTNRWYLRERLKKHIYCGHCFDRNQIEYYPRRILG